MSAAKAPEQAPQDSEVRLRPFLGVKPATYLSVIYSALILAILFFVFIFPGIRNHGTIITFTSVPSGVALYVDDLYAGATPVSVFVRSGTRDILLSRVGYASVEYSLDVGGRLVGSVIFPKRVDQISALSLDDSSSLFGDAIEELSGWALVSPYSASYRPEPVASHAIAGYVATASDTEPAERFLDAAVLSASDPQIVADVIEAAVRYAAGKGIVSAGALLSTAKHFIDLANEYENALFFLPALARDESARSSFNAPWFARLVQSYGTALTVANNDRFGSLREIAGLRFIDVPAGPFVQGASPSGGEHPHLRSTGAFRILQGEVTQSEYAKFLEDMPYWRPENLRTIVADGLATDTYLSIWNPLDSGETPVRFVSYFAAEAYSSWLTTKLPDGLTARLPTESEWEKAAWMAEEDPELVFADSKDGPRGVSAAERSAATPANLLGNVWEWCSTWFLPLAYAFTSFDGNALEEGWPEEYRARERVVRGGSWADGRVERIDAATRGSYSPEWCTAFTGFRVVVVSE